jgi:putative salt-induced outer membrane protein
MLTFHPTSPIAPLVPFTLRPYRASDLNPADLHLAPAAPRFLLPLVRVRARLHTELFSRPQARLPMDVRRGPRGTRQRPTAVLRASMFAMVLALGLGTLAGPASAQVTLRNDGQWRHLFSAGLNLNAGNTRASALNIASDSVRATDSDKWSVTGLALYARSGEATTAERVAVSTQYNADLSGRLFTFVQAAGTRDRLANLRDRATATTGLGLHLMKRDDAFWDAWAGVAVTQDRYVEPVEIDDALRSTRTSTGLVLAQESSHRFGEQSTFKQKLTVLPNLRDRGQVRSEFSARLAVAINSRLSLSTGLTLRHDNRAPAGVKSVDAALVTGVSLRFD